MLLLYFILQLRSPLQPIQATPSARQKKKKKNRVVHLKKQLVATSELVGAWQILRNFSIFP